MDPVSKWLNKLTHYNTLIENYVDREMPLFSSRTIWNVIFLSNHVVFSNVFTIPYNNHVTFFHYCMMNLVLKCDEQWHCFHTVCWEHLAHFAGNSSWLLTPSNGNKYIESWTWTQKKRYLEYLVAFEWHVQSICTCIVCELHKHNKDKERVLVVYQEMHIL